MSKNIDSQETKEAYPQLYFLTLIAHFHIRVFHLFSNKYSYPAESSLFGIFPGSDKEGEGGRLQPRAPLFGRAPSYFEYATVDSPTTNDRYLSNYLLPFFNKFLLFSLQNFPNRLRECPFLGVND